MVRFVDSHVHLADQAFEPDREIVIQRAVDHGAVGLICVGESLAAAGRAEAIARSRPALIQWTAGIHPFDAASWDAGRDLEGIQGHLTRGAVAIGECGLDGSYDNSTREQQLAAFEAQLALAETTRRPVIVHTRQAVDDTIALVRAAGEAGVRGVMHCFTGPVDLAEVALAAGWYVSFSGVVTFKRWTDDDLIRLVPDDRLLVETDAPYLAPVPLRGKRNEPAHARRTLDHVATARNATAEATGELTVQNAARLFGLAIP